MAIVGIGIGIFVFLFTGAFVSEALHVANAGIFPGLVAAIWAARPFMHQAHIQRQNLLHPIPREYKVPAKVAFTKIRDLLADTSYNFGDRWYVATADTQTGRISANLRFTDEHVHWEPDARGHIHTRKERLQRFVAVEIQVPHIGNGNAVIQLDFSPKSEGANFAACDSIISGLANTLDSALGSGAPVGSSADPALPSPPWWLKAITGLVVLNVLNDFMRTLIH